MNFIFPYIGNVIRGSHLFQRGGEKPPSSYQLLLVYTTYCFSDDPTLWSTSASNWEKKALKTTTNQVVKKVCSKMLN